MKSEPHPFMSDGWNAFMMSTVMPEEKSFI